MRAFCIGLLVIRTLNAAPLVLKVHISSGGVTEIPLERYVAGVLAGETSVFQSNEALKAMAVTARTYAVHMRGRHAKEGFDLCDTTHCQRMDQPGITPRLESAAVDTAGELLWFAGKPAFTPYTQDCGGRSESAAEPYLKIHEDPWCQRGAESRWRWNADPREIARVLKRASLLCPEHLERITVIERTHSRRASTLLLWGAGSTRISASSFRFAIGRELGWNTLRGDRYEVRVVAGQIAFEGTGSGNGVGLCQRGAEAMGVAGRSYRDILEFYYPGTVLGLNGQGLRWQRLGGETMSLFTTRPDRDAPVLASAERISRSLSARTGWQMPDRVEIRVYPDVDTFRNATAEPGWVAAHTEGRRIELQPAAAQSALGHELVHVLVDSQAAPGLPIWFREGIADYLEGHRVTGTARIPAETSLRQTSDPDVARRAYADAQAMVVSLVRSHDEAAVLGWVRRGVPPDVIRASSNQASPKSK